MVVGCQPYAPAAFTPGNTPGIHVFDSRAVVRSEGFYVNEKSTDTSWDQTSTLTTVLPRSPYTYIRNKSKKISFFSYNSCITFISSVRLVQGHVNRTFCEIRNAVNASHAVSVKCANCNVIL